MMSVTQTTLAYILKGYPRVSETFISNEILLLERLGFSLRLFPMRKGREDFCHDSVKQIKAQVDYLPTELLIDLPRLIGPNIVCAVKNPGRYRQALATASTRFRRTKKSATFKHLFQAGYLTSRHLAKDPAIAHLHGHFAHSPTSVTMFASLLSGLPFSFTAHAKDIYTSQPDQLKEKIAKATFVTTCTSHNKEHLEQLIGPDRRNAEKATPIYCIYHGIDLGLFNNDSIKIQTQQPYKLLTVARITEKKGLPTVYHALRQLLDRGMDFEHVLIGDGDDRLKILELIQELGLNDRCRWVGSTTHNQVLEEFTRSDLFILGCEIAKDGDRDGVPNVLVESLAMGIPAVATNVSAIPEILVDGETGLTVNQKDSTALADAIIELLTNQELRKKVIAGGRSLVNERYDNSRLITKLAELFAEANPQLTGVKKTDEQTS